MDTTPHDHDGARVNLGLWDAASIIVGIMIGVGIFETPQEVFAGSPGPVQAMLVWALGGALALIGALCFAELASAYPHSGGEYVYLTRAFGPLAGYLFGWAQLAVIRPASIGALAYIFADRAQMFIPLPPLALAIGAVALLTFINILGATLGAHTQNLLTAAKVLGLAGLVIWLFNSPLRIPEPRTVAAEPGWFAIVMFSVLWTYAGWNEAAYIAAEVKNSRRNLPLSLILGTSAVTLIYLLVNGAILLAVGFEQARLQKPSEMIQGDLGRVVNLMIMVSALGAINGMIFTTARIFSAFGQDHRLFRPMSRWSKRGTPVRALIIQGIVNISYLAGAVLGPQLHMVELQPGKIEPGPMDSLQFWILLTAPAFWFFFLLTGLAQLVLRIKEPDVPRPFRTPWYPWLPLVFCGYCAFMVHESIKLLPALAFFSFLILLAGLPLYFLPQKKKKARADQEQTLIEASR